MGSVQSCTINGGVSGNRSASLFSRRAHLLTTPEGRWYFLRKPCALRGGCGSCGSLMDNTTSRWAAVIVHAVGKELPIWKPLLPKRAGAAETAGAQRTESQNRSGKIITIGDNRCAQNTAHTPNFRVWAVLFLFMGQWDKKRLHLF